MAVAKAKELGFETVACASTGNLANAVAAHSAAAGLDSYVFAGRSRGAEAARHRDLRDQHGRDPRHLRRRQSPLHGAQPDSPVGVRERQPAPVLLGGLQDAGLRDDRAARLGGFPTGSSARSPLDRCSPSSPRGCGTGWSWVWWRASCRSSAAAKGCSPVATAFAEGREVCKPQRPDTIAKSLAIGDPADGPYALDLARSTDGTIESVTDDEIRAGISCSPRRPACSPRRRAG